MGKYGNASLAEKKWTLTIRTEWTGFEVRDLIVKRYWYSDKSTVGELWWGDEFQRIYTLEDTVRKGPKINGETAIPTGKYEIVVNYSSRFQRLMPLLLNVPDFEGVRIHSGNTSADTQGCLLVGLEHGRDGITRSRDAFNLIFPRIQEWVQKDKLYIQIVNLGSKNELDSKDKALT